jgi:hypothetical protein
MPYGHLVNHNIAPRGSQRMDRIKYARPLASGFFKQVFKFTKTGRFVSLTFCNWKFGNWTFCIMDVLYPGRSVTGRR